MNGLADPESLATGRLGGDWSGRTRVVLFLAVCTLSL